MEVEFDRTAMPCLQQVLRQMQGQEVTQEIRLPDSTPDVGKILGCWGQVLIRSKEWHGRNVNMSGGVLAFVLYAPEDGSEVKTVDAWLPFQMRWDIPESKRDGSLRLYGTICSMDARSTSAGKILVRANVGMTAQALEPFQAEVYTPSELPEDIQLLKHSYPVCIPVEAGEKPFSMEETLTVDAGKPDIEKVLGYEMQARILDRKVMSEKVVFRGVATVRLIYGAEDGTVECCTFEIPFSQYSELEREYGQNGETDVLIMPSSLEMEQVGADTVQMKAGLVGQYVIFDRPMIQAVEDAYSLKRNVSVEMQTLECPAILDAGQETCKIQAEAEVPGGDVIASSFRAELPRIYKQADSVQVEMSGTFQTFYRNPDGRPETSTDRWEASRSIPADMDSDTQILLLPNARPDASILGQKLKLQSELCMEFQTRAGMGIPMAAGLTLGEETQPDPARPSLVLRRADEEGLWKLAKAYGSTVEAIRSANHLTGEPEKGQFLLIPVS